MKTSKTQEQKNLLIEITTEWADRDIQIDILEIIINMLNKEQREKLIDICNKNYENETNKAKIALGLIEED